MDSSAPRHRCHVPSELFDAHCREERALSNWERQQRAWERMEAHLSKVRDGTHATGARQLDSGYNHDGTRRRGVSWESGSDPEINYTFSYQKSFVSSRPLLLDSTFHTRERREETGSSGFGDSPSLIAGNVYWVSSLRAPIAANMREFSRTAPTQLQCRVQPKDPADGADGTRPIAYVPIGRGYPYTLYSQNVEKRGFACSTCGAEDDQMLRVIPPPPIRAHTVSGTRSGNSLGLRSLDSASVLKRRQKDIHSSVTQLFSHFSQQRDYLEVRGTAVRLEPCDHKADVVDADASLSGTALLSSNHARQDHLNPTGVPVTQYVPAEGLHGAGGTSRRNSDGEFDGSQATPDVAGESANSGTGADLLDPSASKPWREESELLTGTQPITMEPTAATVSGPSLVLAATEATIFTRPKMLQQTCVTMRNNGTTAVYYSLIPRDRPAIAHATLRSPRRGDGSPGDPRHDQGSPPPGAVGAVKVLAGGESSSRGAPTNAVVTATEGREPLSLAALRDMKNKRLTQRKAEFHEVAATVSRQSPSAFFFVSEKSDGVILPGESKCFSFAVRVPTAGIFAQDFDLLTIPSVRSVSSEAPPKTDVVAQDDRGGIRVTIRAFVLDTMQVGEILVPAIDELLSRNAIHNNLRAELRSVLQPGTAFDAAELHRMLREHERHSEQRAAEERMRIDSQEMRWHDYNNHLYYKHRYGGMDMRHYLGKNLSDPSVVAAALEEDAEQNMEDNSLGSAQSRSRGRKERFLARRQQQRLSSDSRPRDTVTPPGASSFDRKGPRSKNGSKTVASGRWSSSSVRSFKSSGEEGNEEDLLCDESPADDLKEAGGASADARKKITGGHRNGGGDERTKVEEVESLIRIPFNKDVYAKLEKLCENLCATLTELTKESPPCPSNGDGSLDRTRRLRRTWDGSIRTLLEDLNELRDAAARNSLANAVTVLLRAASVSRHRDEPLKVLLQRCAGKLAIGQIVERLLIVADSTGVSRYGEADASRVARFSRLRIPGISAAMAPMARPENGTPSGVAPAAAGPASSRRRASPSMPVPVQQLDRKQSASPGAVLSNTRGGFAMAMGDSPEAEDMRKQQQRLEFTLLVRNAVVEGVGKLCQLLDGSAAVIHDACDVPLLGVTHARRSLALYGKVASSELAVVQCCDDIPVDLVGEAVAPPAAPAKASKRR